MKFSLSFLMILALWITLAAQIGLSWFRVAECSVEKTVIQEKTRSFVRKNYCQASGIESKVTLLENDLSQLTSLHKELGEAFEAEVPALSAITPRENTISILRIPMFAETSGEQKLKIHIPPSRELRLRVALEPTGGDETAVLADVQWKPERSVLISLAPGTHVIQSKYSYQRDSATFVASVDTKEIVRFDWNSPQHGFSSSGPAHQQQEDYPPGKFYPPKVYIVQPGATQTRVSISLSEPK